MTPREKDRISILAIGDPHFKIDNLEVVTQYIQKIKETILQHKPTLVIIMGDLLHCHERIHTTVLNKALEFIDMIRSLCPVYVLVGNHDYINNSQFLTDNHWMNALKLWKDVTIVDKPIHLFKDKYFSFVLCPYVSPGRFVEALDTLNVEADDGCTSRWQDAWAIFCHQEFYGCKMGAIESTDGDKWKSDYPSVISGHVHDKQRLPEGIYYVGSSIQHAFGESHDKTIALIIYEDCSSRVEEIDLGLSKKHILYMDIDDLKTETPTLNPNDSTRITVTGTYEEFKVFKKSAKYKKLIQQNVKIVYRATPSSFGKDGDENEDGGENDGSDIAEKRFDPMFLDILTMLIKKSKEYSESMDALYQYLLR
jgi:DNA repair exonuclease SbcCD nuclease subunit